MFPAVKTKNGVAVCAGCAGCVGWGYGVVRDESEWEGDAGGGESGELGGGWGRGKGEGEVGVKVGVGDEGARSSVSRRCAPPRASPAPSRRDAR